MPGGAQPTRRLARVLPDRLPRIGQNSHWRLAFRAGVGARCYNLVVATSPQASRYQRVSPAAKRMLALGESGRFEFKRDADAVTPGLLAALANWVATDSDRRVAHLLVGVDEIEDPSTGLVAGQPCGLAKGLDRSVARIQDVATSTRPIPVDAFVVEENVAGDTPFIRVEVRPTMPPHFDDQGRRQTRQGRSTRALTDDELLRIYLDREAGSFAARFRQTNEELRTAVGAVGTQVDQIADAIDVRIADPIKRLVATTVEASGAAHAAISSADSAAAAADSVGYEVEIVQGLVRDLRDVVATLDSDSAAGLPAQVVKVRRSVWWAFTLDTFDHHSPRAARLERLLHDLLSVDVSPAADRNRWELEVWNQVLADRKTERHQRGTQKWWTAVVRDIVEYAEEPGYSPPELPDLRARLAADFDAEADDPDSATRQFQRLL